MALLQYLQRKHGLPDPKGSLSSAIPTQAIARAIQEVQAAAADIQVRKRRKRGTYNCYSPRDRADIERYASQHGENVAIHLKAANTEIPLRNSPFSQRMWINFVVIYFRGCPRPRKYFNTIINHTKISEHKNFPNYGKCEACSCILHLDGMHRWYRVDPMEPFHRLHSAPSLNQFSEALWHTVMHADTGLPLCCHWKIGPENIGPRANFFSENIGPRTRFVWKSGLSL